MLKPLLRTIPTMNGNVKISCELSDYNKTSDTEYENDGIQMYDCYVRGAYISPLSHTVFDKKLKASLLGGSYDYDLKTFYTYYNDIFYSGEFPYLKTDMEMIDIYNPIYDRNIDFEMGCSRLTDNTGEVEVFAPIYVESYSDLPNYLIIELNFSTYKKSVTKKIRVNIIRDTNSKYNYLSRYLTKYSNSLDNSFVNVSPATGQAIYNGIDLVHGGVCDATDNEIGNLFKQQNTINNFDAVICLGYKRNLIVMKQVLPLAFRIELDNVLTASEKIHFKNATVTVNMRYYGQNGTEYDFYDWECDYDEYSEKILRMSNINGTMQWVTGNVENIMDVDYPSLNECKMVDYVHSNKLTKNYSRWKLRASDESHPYIVNLSFAFSKNQYSNYLYGQYPQIVTPVTGLCNVTVNEVTKNNEYDLVLPLGIGNTNIYETNTVTNYKNILNGYGYNWFDVIYKSKDENSKYVFKDFSTWKDTVDWTTVENNETYYNGCLHNLELLYAKLPYDNEEKIDKFGVFVKANINKVNLSTVEGENEDNTLTAMYVLERNATNGNCDIAPENLIKGSVSDETGEYVYKLFNTQKDYTLMSAQSRYPDSLSTNGLFYKANNNCQLWTSYTYTDTTSTFTTYSYNDSIRYVNLSELGIYVDDLNVWYDANELTDTYSNIMSKTFEVGYLTNLLRQYQTQQTFPIDIDNTALDTIARQAKSLCLSSAYSKAVSNWMKAYNKYDKSAVDSYTVSSYEMLNLHNMKFILSYDTYTQTYNPIYSLGEDSCYLYTTYQLSCKTNISGEVTEIPVTYTGEDGGTKLFTFERRFSYENGTSPYSKQLLSIVSTYSDLFDNTYNKNLVWKYVTTDGGISNLSYVESEDGSLNHYEIFEVVVNTYMYKDSIVDDLYMVSKEDTSIRNNVRIAYSAYQNVQCNAYVYFDGTINKLGNSYQYTLFRKGDFVHNSLTNSIAYNPIYSDVFSYCSKSSNKYNVNDLIDNQSESYALLEATYIFNELYANSIDKYIQTRYEFMPAVFQNGVEYANNIFIKKDKHKKQFGSCIPESRLDEDTDVIWVDAYNIENVLKYYNILPNDYITNIQTYKARFLNKTHIWWWYTELCKSYDYNRNSAMDKNWVDYVYIKQKSFKNINNKIAVVDVYKPLSDIINEIYIYEKDGVTYDRRQKVDVESKELVTNEDVVNLGSFKQFYDVLENDANNLGYKLQTKEGSDVIKYGKQGYGVDINIPTYLLDHYFDLAFDLKVVRLDKDIYENIIHLGEGRYKDLYLYKVESENSWEHKYQDFDLSISDYSNDTDFYYEECGNQLVPLFNSIYVQEKEDAEIYLNYHLNNITSMNVLNSKNEIVNVLYKVNSPQISWMYKMSDSEFNILISTEDCPRYNIMDPVYDEDGNPVYNEEGNPNSGQKTTPRLDEYGRNVMKQTNWFYNHFGKEIYEYLYYKADTASAEFENDADELGYGIKYFNTRKVLNDDGTTTNYGYYLINMSIDNTLASLYINSNDGEAGYVKYFKYINGVDLTQNTLYFDKLFKQILPFSRVQPTSLLYNIFTLQKPTHLELDVRYKQTTPIDKNYVDSNISEVNTVVTTTSSSTNYDRYFGNISPYITLRTSISNQWILKKKNSDYGMINKGTYPSIGDCVIKKTNMSLRSQHRYNDYIYSSDLSIKSYNNVEQVNSKDKQIDLPENKHFGMSKVVNLPQTIEYELTSFYTYEQLFNLETDDEIYKVFVKANKGNNLTSFNNDEILFLFNRYDYTTTSSPVKLSRDKQSKLYKLKYIFTLK